MVHEETELQKPQWVSSRTSFWPPQPSLLHFTQKSTGGWTWGYLKSVKSSDTFLLILSKTPEQETCCFSDNSLQMRKWPHLYQLSSLITHFVKIATFPHWELEFLISILGILELEALMSLKSRVEVGLWVVKCLMLNPQSWSTLLSPRFPIWNIETITTRIIMPNVKIQWTKDSNTWTKVFTSII